MGRERGYSGCLRQPFACMHIWISSTWRSVISSELPELIGLCDRIYTVFEGAITGEIARADATPENLMKQMTSTKKMLTR